MSTSTLDDLDRLSPEKKRELLDQLLREKASLASAVPLSSGQQRLWFMDRLEPKSPLYNISTALRLTGELNARALEEALNEIVRRHESLRTTFPSVDGNPVQQINPAASCPFQTIDLSRAAEASREAEAQKRIREAASKGFDLTSDVMIRATLLKIAAEEHILIVVLHHIASDEWSLRVLFKELALIYEARMTGTQLTLPDLPIQYADYSLWQKEHLQGETLDKLARYWRKQLEGANTTLELPSDLPRKESANRGAIAHRLIRREEFEAIQNLTRSENSTLFMTLLAAFNVLLNRYTRQEDILIGSPIAGRTRAETEELIGFFVNTLIFRTRMRDDMPFRELLGQVRGTTLGAYSNQDLPFDKLVEMLHPDRSSSSPPFAQVMFALNTDFLEQLLPGLQVEVMEVENGTAKFDLTLVAQQDRNGLRLTAEYDRDLFTSEMIDRLLEHFQNLLRAIAINPETPISRIDFLGQAEKERLRVEWNNTRRAYPRDASISELVERWAKATPKAPAVTMGTRTLTYGELNARANQLARHLRSLGVQRGERVGLMTERSNEMIVAMLGILKAGAAYVPLDPNYPQERLDFMVEDSAIRRLVTQPALANKIVKEGLRTIALEPEFGSISGESEENVGEPAGGLDLANVIYTSGSTGTPKGALITHRGVVRLVRNTDYMEVEPRDVFLQASTISFDAATWEIWGALCNGASVVGITKEELLNPTAYKATLRKAGVTTVFLTTALFNQLANEAPGVFQGLKYVLFGGEACDPKAVASVLANQAPRRLLHVYGPTEATVYSTWHLVRDVLPEAKTIPIGRPIANSTAYVLDGHRNLTPIGVPGELWVGGDGVSQGYLNRPDLTAERFMDDPFHPDAGARLYRSGDLVRLREDGAIEFLGRIDSQVKIRGYRIELGEIDAALLKNEDVRGAVTLVREDTPGQKRVIAYVEPGPDKKVDAATLKAFLKQSLPDYMLPSAFVVVEKFPLNANGKVDRKKLPAPDFKTTDRVFEAPANSAEQQVAKIWERVLGIQPIGATDNFFDLGGHSLLAVKLFAQVEKVFERKLPLATLFKAPTIRQLAEILAGEFRPQAWSTIVDIQPKGTKRPIFWAHSLGGDGGGGFFYYRRLAELLGEDQPSYGIRSPQEPFDKIESMAAFYIRAIKEIQPEGPYQLGGFCFGGVVAYEMARQLTSAGEKVCLLAALESAPPNVTAAHRDAAYSIENAYENLRDFIAQPAAGKVKFVRQKARKIREKLSRREHAEGEKPAQLADLIDMSKYPKDYVRYAETHWKALESYRPGSYEGAIHLFRARKQPLRSFDPSLGWQTLAPGRVKISVIPGTHETMVQDPHVQALAEKLKETIREANG